MGRMDTSNKGHFVTVVSNLNDSFFFSNIQNDLVKPDGIFSHPNGYLKYINDQASQKKLLH